MCNLYSMTKAQAAIIAATRAMHDKTGNLPPLPGHPLVDVQRHRVHGSLPLAGPFQPGFVPSQRLRQQCGFCLRQRFVGGFLQ
jgi:hypothetical protein